MKNRKSQLQIGENLVVLVIFFFLLVIAVVFYANVQKSKFFTKQAEYETMAVIDMKTIISTMPELLCKESNDVTEQCIDTLNLKVMADYWESIKDTESTEREYYRYRFSKTQITIRMLDTLSGNWTGEWTLYNYSGNDTQRYRVVFVPVSLYNVTAGDYSFGVMELKAYSR